MKWDINHLEKKLNRISDELKKETNDLEIHINNSLIENNTELIENNTEFNYISVNNAYKEYISQYSQSYIELSEYYYGPELPYHIYLSEFKNKNDVSTYLDTPKDVIELYKLFIFYGLLEKFIS